ncbi:unnamed protein product, partial [Medioppia subpectinata]
MNGLHIRRKRDNDIIGWLTERRKERKAMLTAIGDHMKRWLNWEMSAKDQEVLRKYYLKLKNTFPKPADSVVNIKTPKMNYTNPEFRAFCKDPTFTDADSSLDGSEILIFKGNKFFVMENLRYGSGVLMASGSTDKLLPNFDSNGLTSMATIQEGQLRGYVFAFYKSQMMSGWSPSGYVRVKHTNQFKKSLTPSLPKNGFETVFHNRDIKDPLLIGLNGDKVYYYKIVKNSFIKVKETTTDKSEENFPSGVTTAFSLPNRFVYMFRNDTFCVRELYYESDDKSINCDIWLDTRIFLGCYGENDPPFSLANYNSLSTSAEADDLCHDFSSISITKAVNPLHILIFRGTKYWTLTGFPYKSIVLNVSSAEDKWEGFESSPDTAMIVSEGFQ